MYEEFVSAGKVEKQTVETLWAEMRHPVEGRKMVSFEQPVTWLLETESKVVFMHGGEEVESFGTYNDFGGHNTSKLAAIERAEQVAETFGVTASSSASVVVKTRTFLRPALKATSDQALDLNRRADAQPGQWKRRWRNFPVSEWRRRKEDGQGGFMYPQVEYEEVSEVVTWQMGDGESGAPGRGGVKQPEEAAAS